MGFPAERPRRLRSSEWMRGLVRETALGPGDLVYPMFVGAGKGVRREISSMPGQFNLSVDTAVAEAQEARSLGVPAVILFGIPDRKDARGSGAWAADGIVQQAIRAIKKAVPELMVITDVCLCEYTDHGHCGVVEGDRIDNDADARAPGAGGRDPRAGRRRHRRAVRHDGRPGRRHPRGARRGGARRRRRSCPTPPSTPPASTGRSATPRTARRSSATGAAYQMDPANVREALREVALDVDEGADMVMVKPALPYLDVIRAGPRAGSTCRSPPTR